MFLHPVLAVGPLEGVRRLGLTLFLLIRRARTTAMIVHLYHLLLQWWVVAIIHFIILFSSYIASYMFCSLCFIILYSLPCYLVRGVFSYVCIV